MLPLGEFIKRLSKNYDDPTRQVNIDQEAYEKEVKDRVKTHTIKEAKRELRKRLSRK